MATSTITPTNIVNMALRSLGENPIQSFTEASRAAELATEHYITQRDAFLMEHPWNFAIVRATLSAFSLPSANLTPAGGATVQGAAGVPFTASSAVFTPVVDVGKTIRAAPGEAVITGVSTSSVVLATITTAFTGALLANGDWRLYGPTPAWGASFSAPIPPDCLRAWRIDESFWNSYQREGDYFLLDQEAVNVLYIRQVDDTTKWGPMAVDAFAARLAARFAENITGQGEKVTMWWKIYYDRLRLAKAADGQEGTPPILRSDSLVRVRRGGWGGSGRPDRWGTW